MTPLSETSGLLSVIKMEMPLKDLPGNAVAVAQSHAWPSGAWLPLAAARAVERRLRRWAQCSPGRHRPVPRCCLSPAAPLRPARRPVRGRPTRAVASAHPLPSSRSTRPAASAASADRPRPHGGRSLGRYRHCSPVLATPHRVEHQAQIMLPLRAVLAAQQ